MHSSGLFIRFKNPLRAKIIFSLFLSLSHWGWGEDSDCRNSHGKTDGHKKSFMPSFLEQATSLALATPCSHPFLAGPRGKVLTLGAT